MDSAEWQGSDRTHGDLAVVGRTGRMTRLVAARARGLAEAILSTEWGALMTYSLSPDAELASLDVVETGEALLGAVSTLAAVAQRDADVRRRAGAYLSLRPA
jgi:hypothetical protein